jgi:hypothetical protein
LTSGGVITTSGRFALDRSTLLGTLMSEFSSP